jgi:broad specificity phosphatase PhoE
VSADPAFRRLLAVRHGQASFGSADYDRLSETGWQQSRHLGDWLAGHGLRFDHVVSGSMRRHRETFEAIAEAYAARGIALPAADIDADLDEFDHRAVINAHLAGRPGERAALAAVLGGAEKDAVARLLLEAIGQWSRGALDAEVSETWDAFGARVGRAGARLAQRLEHGAVLVVSSGGTLSRLAQRALDAPCERAVELSIGLRNSAQCEFFALGQSLRLGSWNALPHLAGQRELWTHY